MYKVNVPVSAFITIKDKENEELLEKNFHSRVPATVDNWKGMCKNLLIPAELEHLNRGLLVNDLVIEAFLQYENLK